MLDVINYETYLIEIGFKSIKSYIRYLNSLTEILEKIDKYKVLSDKDKIIKFANVDDKFKVEFDRYHNKSENAFTDYRIGARKYVEFLNSNHVQKKENNLAIEEKKMLEVKNIILYGAPGVGKTHSYKNLISMIENRKGQKEIFESISNNDEVSLENDIFEIIKQEKRVEFVTFHQSYSYEDFIEGFRPNENGNIERQDGVFKIISDSAKDNLKDNSKKLEVIQSEKNNENIFEKFVDELLVKDEIILNDSVHISNIDDKAFYYSSTNSNGMKNVKILFTDMLEIINNGIEKQKDIKKLSNVMGTTKQRTNYPFIIFSKFKKFKENYNNDFATAKRVEKQNFYIVIDEINRGNISKIFGELITLIEEDKRDKYSVTLPYSKESFSVPSNLYIIATMNSTDKSIATIDIALRRRFTFLKMKPNLTLVKNQDAKKFMKELNIYIEEKLGEDYKLGHSYFMNIQNNDDLEFVKEYKIKPLLEEYFYSENKNANEILQEVEKSIKKEEGNE